MWVFSNVVIKETDEQGRHIGPKWHGEPFEIKKGINEVSEDVGRAYFLYKMPFMDNPEFTDEQKDEMLRQAAITAVRRHGTFAPAEALSGETVSDKAISAITYLEKFKCTDTREALENLMKGSESKPAAKA